jgi:nucleoid-associated protein YgaU
MNWTYVLIGIALAAVIGVAIFLGLEPKAPPPPAETQKAAKVEPPKPAPNEAGKAAAKSKDGEKSDAVKPSFDVVRIEPDGSAVIAGRAAPGAKVTIYNGKDPIGSATANDRGEWTLLPEKNLPPGDTQLTIKAETADGKTVEADKVVVLKVPGKKSDDGALAVMVPKKVGERPKLLQSPAKGPGIREGTLSLDLIDYDDEGHMTFAGRGAPGAALQVYAENKPLAKTAVDDKGDWYVKPESALSPGSYTLRLDQIENGKVTARIEVPFTRSPPIEKREGENFVVVQPGNSLWLIARREFGAGIRYTVIYDANKRQIKDPDLIYPGQVFVVPKEK